MEKNIHGAGKELLNDFALYDGFNDFDNLRSITQSINSIHGVYSNGVEYAVERYLNDVRDNIIDELNKVSQLDDDVSKGRIMAYNEIVSYIEKLIAYPSEIRKNETVNYKNK